VGVGKCEAADAPTAPAAILQELHSFDNLATVLYVAAHPDDENTQLISYLARGRNIRTAYLSLTRGDGGQNLLGGEFGDELGLIRTHELLAARAIDGGEQFFTRAKDFGYSKDYQQTLAKWDREEVVSDIVRVIRTFRPDVIITRFPPTPSNTHGHHTASAVLALEAFKRCGDATAFPDQLKTLSVWQPTRIFMNSGGGGRGGGAPGAAPVHMDIVGNDPDTGKTFAEVATLSRSMHKTQGFGSIGTFGRGGGLRQESFVLMDGTPATKDILDGIDTTWHRVAGGDEVGTLADQAIAQFDAKNPAASLPALLQIRAKLAGLAQEPIVVNKSALLDRIIEGCLGLRVATEIPMAEVVPGEALQMHHTVKVAANVPVKWIGVRYPDGGDAVNDPVDLQAGTAASRDVTRALPAATILSQPYWLREEGTAGMFRVDDASLIGMPDNPPVFAVEDVFDVGGQTLTVADEPVQVIADPKRGELRRKLEAIAPAVLGFVSDVQLFTPGQSKTVQVNVTAFRPNVEGTVGLQAPDGWTVSPSAAPFKLAVAGYQAGFTFTVTALNHPTTAGLTAVCAVGGVAYSNERIEIDYPHIPPLLLQPKAVLKGVCLDLAISGKQVAYLPGAGDSTADSLAQMGYMVTPITGADLTADKLKAFDAVVIGVRAFNTRDDLAAGLPALFDYIKAGGTVVEQYNTPNGLRTPQLGPFPITLSGDLPGHRVTNEKSPVTLLVPDHPAFNTPNKIVPADFDGWVQERGLNFPDQWDRQNYTALLACSDPGEAPLTSGLLVAHVGKGYFVYTGISFFRQLPAGVPGAYRLFANLVSLGK
jgi:LmbE family N-acetylglucosaminyl deacetylase